MLSRQLFSLGPCKLSATAFTDHIIAIRLGELPSKSLAGLRSYSQIATRSSVLSLREKQDSANNPNDRLPWEH